MAIKALDERPEADTKAADTGAAPETAPATGEETAGNPPQSEETAAAAAETPAPAPEAPAAPETAPEQPADAGKVENPGGDTGTVANAPLPQSEAMVEATEQPSASGVSAPAQDTDEAVGNVQVSDMKTLSDPASVRELPEGTMFLAKFIHDPQGDTMWHVKQIMKDLLSGRVIRHNLSPRYWELSAHRRPPVCKKLKGTAYEVME